MTSRASEIVANYTLVKEQVDSLNSSVRLVCVSKYKPASDIDAIYNAGQRHFGENYVQELMEKVTALPQEIQWHFIGALQSNKCAQLAKGIPHLWVETIDGAKKAKKLNDARAASEYASNPVSVFIQVNTSGEEQKAGVSPEDVADVVTYIKEECAHLKLMGLMTIGSIEQSKSSSGENEDFATLVQIRDSVEQSLDIKGLELSMGMSSDFEEAIKQGSTNVRIGSTIFGGRKTKDEMK